MRLKGLVVASLPVAVALSGCEGPQVDHYFDRDFIKAAITARGALADNPGDTQALEILAWSELHQGRDAYAKRLFERLEAIRPKNFQAVIGGAWARIKLNEFKDAEIYLDRAEALAFDQEAFMVVYGRGWLALKQGDLERAHDQFRFAETFYVDYRLGGSDPREALGRVAMARGRTGQAETHFRTALARNERCHTCYLGLARLSHGRGRYREALAFALKGVRLVRHDMELVALLDDILVEIGDVDLATRSYMDLIVLYPRDTVYQVRLGRVMEAQNQFHAARARYRAALELSPGDFSAARGLASIPVNQRKISPAAWAHRAKGLYSHALAEFDRQAERAAAVGNASVQDGRGWTFLEMKEPAQAKEAFHAALAIDPGFERSRVGMILAERASIPGFTDAWRILEGGDMAVAEGMFRQIGETFSRDNLALGLANEGLGWAAMQRHEKEAARAHFLAARRHTPDTFMASWGLGLLALERRDHAAAERHLVESVVKQPFREVSLYAATADTFLNLARPAGARRLLLMGERAHPDSAEIQMLLARAEAALGQRSDAVARAELGVRRDPLAAHGRLDGTGLEPADILALYHTVGWALYSARDYENALVRFEQYLNNGGGDINARRGRGLALYRLGRYGECIPDLMAASAHEPDPLETLREAMPVPGTDKMRPVVYNATTILGWAYLRTGRPRHAEAAFLRALAIVSDWLDARTGLAYAYLEQKRRAKAVGAFRDALKLAPGHADARRGYRAALALE